MYLDPEGNIKFWGDIEREVPGWSKGDPAPTGWRDVIEVPLDESKLEDWFEDELEPAAVDGYIPEGCEGVRKHIASTKTRFTAEFNAGDGKWYQTWQYERHDFIATDENPYPIVAVMVDGEWLTPEQYRALG